MGEQSDDSKTGEVDKIEDKIEDIKDKIEDTPIEDKDASWKASVNSALDAIAAQLSELKTSHGKSPELATLEASVSALARKVDKLVPKEPKPQGSAEGDNPTRATPPETSSDPKRETPTQSPPAEGRRKREWL